MPVVLLFMAVEALATGISALVIHDSVSKSTSSSNILSEIGESKENFEKEIKTKLFLGTVSIIIYIEYSEQIKKKQQEEMLQSIGGGVAASTELSTAVTIKVAKDAIAELQTEQGQEIGSTTSQTTEVSGSVAISNDGPIIPPLIPPALKELEDYILWAKGKNNGQKKEKYIPNTGIWTPTGNKKSEWLKENNYRTQWRDREKDQLRNKDGKPVSLDLLDENGNIIGRIDKNYRVNGKVVPEHAHLDSDINNVHRWFND